MPESYLHKRVEEQNLHYEALNRLHDRLQVLIGSYGHAADPGDESNKSLVTKSVKLTSGWHVSVYKPDEFSALRSNAGLVDPVGIFVSPTLFDNDNFVIPYLDESAGFWIMVGENCAEEEETSVELSTDEIDSLFIDVIEIIEPGLLNY